MSDNIREKNKLYKKGVISACSAEWMYASDSVTIQYEVLTYLDKIIIKDNDRSFTIDGKLLSVLSNRSFDCDRYGFEYYPHHNEYMVFEGEVKRLIAELKKLVEEQVNSYDNTMKKVKK